MLVDGQGTKCRRNIAENLNCLSRAHERYRRQTDGRATAYSEREREFTFANNTESMLPPTIDGWPRTMLMCAKGMTKIKKKII